MKWNKYTNQVLFAKQKMLMMSNGAHKFTQEFKVSRTHIIHWDLLCVNNYIITFKTDFIFDVKQFTFYRVLLTRLPIVLEFLMTLTLAQQTPDLTPLVRGALAKVESWTTQSLTRMIRAGGAPVALKTTTQWWLSPTLLVLHPSLQQICQLLQLHPHWQSLNANWALLLLLSMELIICVWMVSIFIIW